MGTGITSSAVERRRRARGAGAGAALFAGIVPLGSFVFAFGTAASLNIAGATNGNAANKLSPGHSREFRISIKAPASFAQQDMNQRATLALTWRAEQ